MQDNFNRKKEINIIKESLSEQIYKVLKQDIIDNHIKFGEIIVNKNLQERFNVSSTPIRDAILKLKEDGIVDEITRSGARLIDFDSEFACQVNQLLIIITTGAIELAFQNKNKVFIKNLKKYLELMDKNIENHLYYEYDFRFHKEFFDCSNNKILIDLFKKYNLIFLLLVRSFHKEDINLDIRKRCIEDHKKIIEFFEKNNLSETIAALQAHYLAADLIFRKIKTQ